jgi:signal transduction histidine kinase/CheY-like chemotaxis protein
MDQSNIQDNITLEQTLRRANLLAAAAEVSQNLTQIMNIDELLPKTVDIICDAYDFYYAGVFLIDNNNEFAVLRAGHGAAGRIMMENHHKLAVGGNSMIGACTAHNEARISLDVDTEKVWYPNPVLPETRSEMALPLAIGSRVIGALTVQSVEAAAFSDEDVASLQAMANQLAIALDNAQKRRELDEAHAELLRAKTFEAIATATGDAIHWIGNKAEPIGGSVQRIRQDTKLFTSGVAKLLPSTDDSSLAQLLRNEATALEADEPGLADSLQKLEQLPVDKLKKRLSVSSILDDLEIIEDSARLIMRVKEDLIGPAREQAPRPAMIDDVLQDALTTLDMSPDVVSVSGPPNLPLVLADPIQLNRVFVNLLNNALEATETQQQPQIAIDMATDTAGKSVNVSITDNGGGIPAEDLDKIWITFHTTKGIKGHSGLGLPACRLILQQLGGDISVSNRPGQGATFSIAVPIAPNTVVKPTETVKGRGTVLIIDDNDRWQNFASGALTGAGFRVAACSEDYGFDALDKFDLILMDDILVEEDSLAVLERIKAANGIAKVLMVSSNPRVERTKDRMLLGIKNLVPKPYTKTDIVTEVLRVLQ